MRRSRGGRFGIIEGGSGEIWRAQRADFEGGSVGLRGGRTGSGSETPAPWVRGLSRGWWCEGGDRVAKDYLLPLSRISWHACATETVESGSFVRSSLRDRTPYGGVLRRGVSGLLNPKMLPMRGLCCDAFAIGQWMRTN